MIWIIILIFVFFFLMPLIKRESRQKEEMMKKKINEMGDSAQERDVENPYDFVSSNNEDEAHKVESLFSESNYNSILSDNFLYDIPLDTPAIEEGQRTLHNLPQNLQKSIYDNEISASESDVKKKIKKIDGKDMVIYSEIIKSKF